MKITGITKRICKNNVQNHCKQNEDGKTFNEVLETSEEFDAGLREKYEERKNERLWESDSRSKEEGQGIRIK